MEYHFVYLSEVDISVDNGRGINEREFVRALLEQHGDSVTCILPRPAHPDRYQDAGIEYVTPHGGSAVPYGLHLTDSFRRLRAVHAKRPVSGLVTRLEVVPFVPFLAQRWLDVPIILKTLAVYGVFGHHDRSFRPHRMASRAMAPAFRSTIEGCLVADTVGEAMAEWTRSQFSLAHDQLVVIPNGANTDMFIPGESHAAKRALGVERFDTLIGYVGILGPDRGLDLLIEEVHTLRSQGLHVGLLLVGDGPIRGELEALVQRRNLGEHIVFHGQIPYDEVPGVMQALDMGVDLSLLHLKVDAEREIPASFSQKLAQYLASGVPVVAWDLPDTRFVTGESVGRLVPVGEPLAVCQAVSELAHLPPAARAELKKRCRTVAEEQFSIRELVRRRFELWENRVMENGNGASR
jgi:glycosyltransferase involved in cell wall biosynthesis